MGRSIKILVVIGQLDVGGTERHLLNVMPAVNRSPFSVKIFVLRDGGALIPQFASAGVEVIRPRHRSRRWLGVIRSAAVLCRTLWRERPDIVHFFLPEAYLVGGLCSLAGPRCVRLMSRRSLNAYQQKLRFSAPLERLLHRHMAGVLANSRAVVRDLRLEGIADADIGLIYNGVTVEGQPGPEERRRTRSELGVDDQALIMIMIANLIPYKGHDDLLEALGPIAPELETEWRLVLIGGDSGIEAELRRKAERLGIGGRVIWLGMRPDVARYLRAADIGILCSHQEGFSNAVLEGMAAGLPMVVSDAGGNPEAVVDGSTGLVVRAGDVAALGRAVLRLANDSPFRRYAGAAARARVKTEFALETCINAYRRVYWSVVQPARKPVAEVVASPFELGG